MLKEVLEDLEVVCSSSSSWRLSRSRFGRSRGWLGREELGLGESVNREGLYECMRGRGASRAY
jgi:hypothetical protein